MATTTRIEWADITINPVRGCSHCSPGCDHCYAERVAARLARIPNTARAYAGLVDVNGKWTGRFSVSLDTLDALSIKPRRIFVGSMCDLFHENLPYNLFLWIVEKLSRYPQHTFMLLTKRPERMKHFISLTKESDTVCGLWPLPNLWLGVTVCNQAEADAKIPVLLETPAEKRFVSVEPMLGPVEIGKYLYGSYECAMTCGTRLAFTNPPEKRCTACGFTGPDDYETWGNGDSEICPECGEDGGSGEIEEVCPGCGSFMVREHPDTQNIDWVIAGTETGPKARAADEAWFRSLRDQCHAYHSITPFFLKKNSDGSRLLDGREWNEVPQ